MGLHKHSKSKGGFTLLEMMISVVLLLGIFWGFTIFSFGASNAYREGQMVETLAMQANRSIEFVTRQLAYAERATIPDTDPVFGDSSMDYRSCSGAAGRVLLWSPTQSIGVQLEQGELDDGIDNNGNGLVDEGRLVFIQDLGLATEQQTTKGHWIREYLEGELPNGIDDNGNGLIDERGLTFQTNGSTVDVQLTLETLDPSGRLLTKTVRSTIRIRN